MEVKRLKALHKLAKDILNSEKGTRVTLDERLFSDIETNKISLTVKNYDRPNGMAT